MQQFTEDLKKGYIEDQLSRNITYNVIGKEETEERVSNVFRMINEALSRSFGPGGAPTIISQYPAHYSTKDGHHISSSIYMDNKFDQCIKGLIYEISERLNVTVGDGTTTANISSYHIFNAYKSNKEYFENQRILPRHIMRRLDYLKDEIINEISNRSIQIDTSSPEALMDSIRKTVFISSNGDNELTDKITNLYGELMHPAITVKESLDGYDRSYIIDGFKCKIGLTDPLYINNDNKSFIGTDIDVIMFDHKIGSETYDRIIKELNNLSSRRGRQLLCIAPSYDEFALKSIAKELTKEYKETNGKCNLILAVASFINADATTMADLSVLLNTEIINVDMAKKYMERCNNEYFETIFDLDCRNIDGLLVPYIKGMNPDPETGMDIPDLVLKPYDVTNTQEILFQDIKENSHKIGFIKNVEMTYKNAETTFKGFYYNQAAYDKLIQIVKDDYDEITNKAKNNGVFNHQLLEKKQRYFALRLKTGVIEYGGTSELAKSYNKDVIDDAIKAASSAYYNGTILGCNVTLLRSIKDVLAKYLANDLDTKKHKLDIELLNIIYSGFVNVYKTVLINTYGEDVNKMFTFNTNDNLSNEDNIENPITDFFNEIGKVFGIYNEDNYPYDKEEDLIKLAKSLYINIDLNNELINNIMIDLNVNEISIADIIVELSVRDDVVYDVSNNVFSKDVINSANTDKEILKATVDLLSLLINSNQFILQ